MANICLIDFAGNNRQPGFWADYYPDTHTVIFGGLWEDVPPLPVLIIPDIRAAYEWAWAHHREERKSNG